MNAAAARPPRSGISIADVLAGLYAAIGMLAACWRRDGPPGGEAAVLDGLAGLDRATARAARGREDPA